MTENRFVSTEGIHNLRDYGGWPTSDGKRVKCGLLYRSGQHVGASDADLAALDALDIRTVIDLRGTTERERNPCRRSDRFDAEVIAHDGETSSSPPHMDVDANTTTAQFARERMMAVYSRMPNNPAMTDMFGRYFRALDERDGASLVHCFAGKDRTGIAATLLLHVLGVSEEDQMTEFLRTNDAPTQHVLREQSVPGIEERLGRKLDEDAIAALIGVHGDYLAHWRCEVAALYGSVEGYLTHIGVDEDMRARLRARFVG